jgi:hypothetical protein
MKRFLAVLALIALLIAPAFAAQETVASFPTFDTGGFVTNTNGSFSAALTQLLKKECAVFSYPYTVAATNTPSISGAFSFVFITPQAGAVDLTNFRMTFSSASATSGQIAYIYNQSASQASIVGDGGSSIATCSASGGRAHLLYASGTWYLLEDQ